MADPLGLTSKARIYRSSTSVLYGLLKKIYKKERAIFFPCSHYGVAILYACWIGVDYCKAY